ncbi:MULTISPECIES: nucleoside 2-deoxyribosyltransferase [unclassified Phenylobacterium]|jgi:nucleoside 2-deoxyribosyltransferase|uniref:nucleoside 2-deoxyribosyltransferase n=1 Tax=unclassified Phenylobacterium TaxID=2640670 RepID=UPI00083A16A1|nr:MULTISPECIES: nucleoside 2-deoxyribosyltransferase [unclassified Phenylobacterium]
MNNRFCIYFAAPLFNPRELAYNLSLVSRIEALGATVFLPQRDGALLVEMLAAGVPQSVAERRVFLQDTGAMRAASFGVAVLDGSNIDDGVAFEIGYLHALGVECIGLQTDVRRALPTGNNPMIGQALQVIARDEDELLSLIDAAHQRHRELLATG